MGILDRLRAGGGGGDGDVGEVGEGSGHSSTGTIRKIVEALDSLDPDQARYIALFAYILGRVAHADLEIDDEETREMERQVVEYGSIPPEQAMIVVQMAKTHNQLFGGTDGFLVTREFDQIASKDEKMALLECLFAVSASDESISSVEDNEVRKISGELHLSQRDFVTVRSRFREHLEVFKNRPEQP
jgi:uncharacterized tellurite resistance protein B-like protein